MKRYILFAFFLLLALLIGSILRSHNLSSFKIYPDSYQNLIVAENIQIYGSVVGTLGPDGVVYPPFFMWSRPVYALLINTFSWTTFPSDLIAQYVAYIAGLAAIPLSFFVVWNIFRNALFGVAAASLLAFSFNHTVWSGFIMTETIGVFFILLFLWSFSNAISKPVQFGTFSSILSGALFAIATMTRYEYLILIIPITLFIFLMSKTPKPMLSNFLIGSGIVFLMFALTLFPLDSVVPIILTQMHDLLIRFGIAAITFAIVVILYKRAPSRYKTMLMQKLPRSVSFMLIAIALLLTVQSVFRQIIPFYTDLSFIRGFAGHDVLISAFAMYGWLLLLSEKRHHAFAYCTILACILLAITYHRVNPDMERYMTHLIPFLLLPASYGLVMALRQKNKGKIIFATVFLLGIQISISYNGLRYLNDPSWYTKSYEENAAEQIANDISENDILLVSLPEPYFYETGITTHSVNDTPPFIYIPKTLDDRTVYIIQDMATKDYFPTFNKFIDTNLQQFKSKEFQITTPYHTTNKSLKPSNPINVYKIKLNDLKKIITDSE